MKKKKPPRKVLCYLCGCTYVPGPVTSVQHTYHAQGNSRPSVEQVTLWLEACQVERDREVLRLS